LTVGRERGTKPLHEYATLTGAFTGVLGGFLLLAGPRLPERIGWSDMARVGLASYKIGRLVAKERVTKFVRAPVTQDDEASEPEPVGWRRALGELVTCPHCVGLWTAAVFSYGLVLFPRQTRFVTALFGAQAIADFLNTAYVKTRD
jgi:Protein of unknown function (DUF1360)